MINVTVPLGINDSGYNNKTTRETMSGVMGGTPLRNRRDRRLHSVTKSLNLSPQRC